MPQQENYTRYAVLARLESKTQNPQELIAKWGEIKQECEEIGVTVDESFAVLGDSDFLMLLDAPSRDRVFQASLIMGREGLVVQTMPIVSTEQFGDIVRDR